MNFAQPVLDFLGDDGTRQIHAPDRRQWNAGRWSNAMSVPPLARSPRQD